MRCFPLLLLAAALAVSVLAPGSASGRESFACNQYAAHVTVTFEGEFSDEVKTGVLSDLSASLAPQQMSACREAAQKQPKAVAALHLSRRSGGTVRIEVDDTLTSKRVSRDVALRATSEGSAALILAVAADELLRATWAELSLKKRSDEESESDAGAPTSERETPSEKQQGSSEAAAPKTAEPGKASSEDAPLIPSEQKRLPWARAGVGAALDVFPSASALFGADAFFGGRIAEVGEWTLLIGPRISREQKASPLGGAAAQALSAQGQGLWPAVRRANVVFGPTVSVQYLRASFQGTSGDEDIRTSRAAGWALVARGGALLRIHFGLPYLGVSADWGGAVRGFQVTDGASAVGGMSGFVFSSGLFAGGAFGR